MMIPNVESSYIAINVENCKISELKKDSFNKLLGGI